jgi:hypothetical protein
MSKRLLCLTCLCLIVSGPPTFAHGSDHKHPTYISLSALPAGKTIQTAISPDRRWQLLIRDEEKQGDYFYYAYYFFNGQEYQHLNDYVATGQPTRISWTQKSVRFQARSPVAPGKVEVLLIEYLPQHRKLNTRVLRTEAMEMTG